MNRRTLIQIGLLAGAVAGFIAIIGMVETFNSRGLIQNILTLGRLLLLVPPVLAGLFAARRATKTNSLASSLQAGAIAGLVTSITIMLLVILQSLFPAMRQMFINLSPTLTEIATYGQGVGLGSILIALSYALLGALGGLYTQLPPKLQNTVRYALLWLIGLGLFGGVILANNLRNLIGSGVRTFFVSDAMTPLSAGLVLLIAGAYGWFSEDLKTRRETRNASLTEDERNRQRIINSAIGIALLLVLPFLLGRFLSEVLGTVGLFVMMGLGLNIAIGLAGLLDLGYVTNYAVGAYVMGVLTTSYDWPFWFAVPVCVVAAMFTGFVFALPVLQMRGDYLAIATLGFGEIIRVLAISDWLAPYIGGAQGILGISRPRIGNFVVQDPQYVYFIILAGCLAVIYVMVRLNNSRTGRQWMAIREDEDVAEAMGINLVRTKVLAFTLSAAAGGLAGAIFAARLTTIFPTSFNVFVSINVLSLIIVGGMGSIPGIIVGALFLIGTPELLREFSEYRYLLYGAVLVGMMLTRPEGLIPSAIRRRELHQDADEEPGDPEVAATPTIQ